MKKAFYLIIAIITIMTACRGKQEQRVNPFFEEWGGEFGLPPFAEITDADYRPAVLEGIRQPRRSYVCKYHRGVRPLGTAFG